MCRDVGSGDVFVSHLFTRESRDRRKCADRRPKTEKAARWPPFKNFPIAIDAKLKLYLPEAAPAACGYMPAIFSSRAFMLRPVSRVASTAGWPSPSVCVTRTRVSGFAFFTM